MAVSVTKDFDKGQPYIVKKNGVPEILHGWYEANSQTMYAGEFCMSSVSASTIIPATTGDVEILGIALRAATNVTSGNVEIPVQLIDQDDEIYMRVTNNSGVLEDVDTTCKLGLAYDILVTSNAHTINSSDTTNPKFIYLGPRLDVNGDKVLYWGRFRPFYLGIATVGGKA